MERDPLARTEPSDPLGAWIARALPGPLDLPPRVPAQLAEDAARPEPGREVAGFRLLRRIGRGGMGEVWEAEQIGLGGRRVALKFVRPDRVSPRQLDYFAREARAGGRLNHPGIVAVYDRGTTEGLDWIAMELVEGGRSLRSLIEEVARSERTPSEYDRGVARLVASVAEAMQVAHEAGVVHRDLKPQNILLTEQGVPKVTDFGLARLTDESAFTRTGERCGTPSYMSPEQARGGAEPVDHRTDVYSLGVVLFELLTRRRPFESETSDAPALDLLRQDAPDPRAHREGIPRDLAVITLRALAKEPRSRFATMGDLAADLRRFLAHEPILAQPPSLAERGRKWVRRHRSLAISLALLLVLAPGWGIARARSDSLRQLERRETARTFLNELDAARNEARIATANESVDPMDAVRELLSIFRRAGVGFGSSGAVGASAARLRELLSESRSDLAVDGLYLLALELEAVPARTENELGDRPEAIQARVLETAERFAPTTGRARIWRSWQAAGGGSAGFERLTRSASDLLEGSDEALEFLCDLLASQRLYEKLEPLLEELVEREPDSFIAHYRLAGAAHGAGDRERHLLHAEIARALRPGSRWAWFSLGVAHQERQENAEAYGCYRRALDIDPNFSSALQNFVYLAPEAELDEAACRIRETVWRAAGGFENLCSRLQDRASWDELLRTAGDGLARWPESKALLWYRAFALDALGRSAEAESAYRALLTLHPDSWRGRANLSLLLLAKAAERCPGDDLDECCVELCRASLEQAEAAFVLEPTRCDVLTVWAAAQHASSRFEGALDALELALDTNDHRARDMLEQVLDDLKTKPTSGASLERAESLLAWAATRR